MPYMPNRRDEVDEEIVDVLIAISVIAKRLATKLQMKGEEEYGKEKCRRHHCMHPGMCPDPDGPGRFFGDEEDEYGY